MIVVVLLIGRLAVLPAVATWSACAISGRWSWSFVAAAWLTLWLANIRANLDPSGPAPKLGPDILVAGQVVSALALALPGVVAVTARYLGFHVGF